jgi:FMN phosphatase YigB (HAD superfamily)
MSELAFLFDVDNTLLDNDRAKADLAAQVERLVGPERGAQFWEAYEQVRREVDVVDYPRTLARFRAAFPDEPRFPEMADRVLAYPYQEYLYPGALEAIAHCRTLGTVAIVSDGDAVYQAAKIARAGLAAAVDNRVMICLHKETRFAEILQRFPADRYVLVDDKPRILAAAKGLLRDRVVTLLVRQGHYAAEHADYPAPDLTAERIGDVQRYGCDTFRPAADER